MNLDRFMSREYVPKKYICTHFVAEVWAALTGEDLLKRLGLKSASDALPRNLRDFRRLSVPESPCLVLLTQLGFDPHLGIFVDGNLLHLTHAGPECFSFEIGSRGFTSHRFYK